MTLNLRTLLLKKQDANDFLPLKTVNGGACSCETDNFFVIYLNKIKPHTPHFE